MNKKEFKELDREQMIIAFNQLKDDYSVLFDELEQEKEKNNELEIELSTRDNINVDKLVEKYKYYRRLTDSYQANCISKDKIKEKIEEIEKEIEIEGLSEKDNDLIYTPYGLYKYAQNNLKELLEEK